MVKQQAYPFPVQIPDSYWPLLNTQQTLEAIGLIHDRLTEKLSRAFDLVRLFPPTTVYTQTGLGSDHDLNFGEQSLLQDPAKWCRCAIARYGLGPHQGILCVSRVPTACQADCFHAAVSASFCLERRLTAQERFLSKLEEAAHTLADILSQIHQELRSRFFSWKLNLSAGVLCLTTQYLENLYPSLTVRERERKIFQEQEMVFLEQTPLVLDSGKRHETAPPDVDDWRLSGRLLVWNPLYGFPQPIARLGVRVTPERFLKQCKESGCSQDTTYHRLLLDDRLPLTMGGEVDFAGLCMLLLGKAHIGEVLAAPWPDDTVLSCLSRGIHLL